MADPAAPPPIAVFDVDGTLADTVADLTAALNAVGGPRGLPSVAPAAGRTLVGGGARAMIQRAFAAHGRALDKPELDALLAEFLAYYGAHLVDHSRLYPGTEAALDRLSATGWRLAVCTNKGEAMARKLLTLLGIADRFSAIAGQDTFGVRKPDPRHLTETVREAGGSAERAVMIGDSRTDAEAARAAGIPFVVVTFGYPEVPVASLGADAVIGDYRELGDALEAIALSWQSRRIVQAPRGADL